MTNLAEQAQEGATRAQTMAAARSPRVRDAIKVDRGIKTGALIETPAMVIKRTMQQANRNVRHTHDQDCVCVWHVIGRLTDSAQLAMRLQTNALRKSGTPDRDSPQEGFGSAYSKAYANTRERIKGEANALESRGSANEAPKGEPANAPSAATPSRPKANAVRRPASLGID